MKRKELEKLYTICIIICSFVLIVNIWYAVTFAPDIRKEILYGIMLIVNFFYLFFNKIPENSPASVGSGMNPVFLYVKSFFLRNLSYLS